MTTRLKGRRRDAAAVIEDIAIWAAGRDDVVAVAVVGSYARGAERMGSDVDIIVLADRSDPLTDVGWFRQLRPRARLIRSKEWGPVKERRMRLPSGLQVELGFAASDWAAVPLDPGTRRVLSDGHRIVYDTGILTAAVAAL
ncbi:nucleotidyltransferase [Microbacterium sp. Root166]|uniref:nucleotidyltransferase domain-containing protein n=1 Tax=Microbacterium sp. Root166 TaxID=1736478 RepID=UPI0006F5659E|nr:nucleotidyltransferase domain-containing protein [Microbacterium sp. Root166]KQZ85566.1 nucleotidyltransferase [Microbacterium sp. Root166]